MRKFKDTTVYRVGINDHPKDNMTREDYDKMYMSWKGLLARCYSEPYLKLRPTYRGCYVLDEWHRLSDFKKWWVDNYIEGYHLDKDIIKKGNKEYSSAYCVYVPKEINHLLTKHDNARGKYPIGVGIQENGLYYARLKINKQDVIVGKNKSTPEEAFKCYKEAKEAHIKNLANQYFEKGLICSKARDGLLRYEVEIDD